MPTQTAYRDPRPANGVSSSKVRCGAPFPRRLSPALSFLTVFRCRIYALLPPPSRAHHHHLNLDNLIAWPGGCVAQVQQYESFLNDRLKVDLKCV